MAEIRVGDRRRIQTHIRGAEVAQVLRAPFQQVVLAETALKQRYRQQIIRSVKRGMIGSFGQATEVTHRRQRINLLDVLPDGEDITYSFEDSSPKDCGHREPRQPTPHAFVRPDSKHREPCDCSECPGGSSPCGRPRTRSPTWLGSQAHGR